MIKFDYYARDPQGKPKKGIVEAIDRNQAALILRRMGLILIEIKVRKESFLTKIQRVFLSRVKIDDVVNFTRQLSTMINAGLVITDAMVILRSQTENPRMVTIVDSLQKDIEGGKSASEAMARFPQVFDSVYVSLVRSGETAGILDKILSRLADNLEKKRDFLGKIKGAMVYPVIIVTGMILVAAVMMIFVIPKLLDLYQEFEATLPLATMVLMSVSKFMARFWWLLLILVGSLVWGFRLILKTETGRLKMDSIIFALPVIGKLRRSMMLTEFTRTFGLLVEGGVLVVESLGVAEGAMGSPIYKKAVSQATAEVERGTSLAVALSRTEAFPPLLSQMVSVGEETGKLDEVLLKIASYFEQEASAAVRNLTTAIEPIIMIVMGIGVTFLIIAVIMPIYNLTSQF
ncbi:MAG: type II secretion system F family protein [Candidatus Pacebacteria bacterium]|nr:type II secretion system F family protein [Candidatus Paceibacterota bacterium]